MRCPVSEDFLTMSVWKEEHLQKLLAHPQGAELCELSVWLHGL